MLVKINIGGIDVYFGTPYAPQKPEPFYPYLLEVDAIRDSTGEETGSTGCRLSLKAQALIDVNLRRQVVVLKDNLEPVFTGILRRIAYNEAISLTVEA